MLCWTRPPEWWDLDHPDGNRLALTICRRCPVVGTCGRDKDQHPHGVIMGAVAYSPDEPGVPMALCGTCGYPASETVPCSCRPPLDVPIPADRRCPQGHWKTPTNVIHPAGKSAGRRACRTCTVTRRRNGRAAQKKRLEKEAN